MAGAETVAEKPQASSGEEKPLVNLIPDERRHSAIINDARGVWKIARSSAREREREYSRTYRLSIRTTADTRPADFIFSSIQSVPKLPSIFFPINRGCTAAAVSLDKFSYTEFA